MMYNKNGKIKLNSGKRPIIMRRGGSYNNNKKKNNRIPPRMPLFDRDLLENTPTGRTQEQEENLANLHRKLNSITFGDKTVLAVRVFGNGVSYDYTPDELSNSVFGTNGKALTLKSQYTACSYGSINFDSMGNRTMMNPPNDDITTDIIGGIVTVKVNTAITSDLSDTEDAFEEDVTKKLNRVFGVNSPEELADHVMYCLPEETMDGESHFTLLL